MFGVATAVVVGLFVCLFEGVFAAAAPSSWKQVHAGMTRTEVLALVGQPQTSGWPENIAETWDMPGLVAHRRLFIVYEGERVKHLWDGNWVRGFGWSRPRRESL